MGQQLIVLVAVGQRAGPGPSSRISGADRAFYMAVGQVLSRLAGAAGFSRPAAIFEAKSSSLAHISTGQPAAEGDVKLAWTMNPICWFCSALYREAATAGDDARTAGEVQGL